MTSELEEMGEPMWLLQGPGGRGQGGLDHPLSLLVLLVTRGPCPHPVPQPMGRTLSGLRVCRWEGVSESLLSSVLSYLFLCWDLSQGLCVTFSAGSAVSFLLCPLAPTPILHLSLH